jgi:hypothetical protein
MSNNTAQDSKKENPRDRFFICAANLQPQPGQAKKLILMPVKATSKEEAEALFEKEHGVKPAAIESGEFGGGYYLVKGVNALESKRVSVSVEAKDLARPTSKSFSGVFHGWHVYCTGLKSCKGDDGKTYKDNDLMIVNWDKPVNEKDHPKKMILKRQEVIPATLIQDRKELT